MHRIAIAIAAASFLAACGSDSNDPAPAPDQAVTINFKAVVNAVDFACSSGGAPTSYTLGTAGSTFSPRDFRLYVHDVRLIYHDGSVASLQMTNDGTWQKDGLALLDFEDGTGNCSTTAGAAGDAATHTAITGRAPVGHVHTVIFKVGVPESMNHLSATTAAPPLNKPALFWNWTGGYKHVRIDGAITSLPVTDPPTPNVHNFHLGATGCTAVDPADPAKGAICNTLNTPVVRLDVDLETQSVAIDLAALFANANLDNVGTAVGTDDPGCMSKPSDPQCAPIFSRLGLPAGAQAVFSAR